MEPVQRRKLSEEVLDRLVTAIATREFPPGSQLPSERELMAMVGVGRPSIREAMQALSRMGLIRISHGERARVVEPTAEMILDQVSSSVRLLLATSPDGLDELKEARRMVEAGLVRLAATRVGPEEIARLREVVEELRAARDGEAFVAADMEFHGLIAEASGNSIVAAAVRGMLGWLSGFKRDLVSVRGAEAVTIEEHLRILAAMEARDPDAAERAMTDHLTRASGLYAQLGASSG